MSRYLSVLMEKEKRFFLSTHTTRPEAFSSSIIGALKRKGIIVIGTGHCYGSFNDQQFPKPYLTDGHPDEIDLEEAKEFDREMVERSKMIYAGETQLIPIFQTGRRIGMQMAQDVQRAAASDMLQIPASISFKHGARRQPRFKSQAKLNLVTYKINNNAFLNFGGNVNKS